ncbi:hypothetical protein [Pseudomonas turukhanskensis]|uniref:Uncharacterized protein n=1 Tax=Pseudomonas turukhanskensis TaxID=1806536 RepID=A0A9W6K6B0_9PSED|nr:hypothetical protein [Pseudomonas turukhanskensis]GLK88294.1 hypothetical protein GCM10017655_13560 [Pseudomonas turukhanskensis]
MSVAINALLAGLSEEQREAVLVALEAERGIALGWWTFLNEMRVRRELPDWVAKQYVGCSPDHDEAAEKKRATNMLLFGEKNAISNARLTLINANIDAINAAEGSEDFEDFEHGKAEVAL